MNLQERHFCTCLVVATSLYHIPYSSIFSSSPYTTYLKCLLLAYNAKKQIWRILGWLSPDLSAGLYSCLGDYLGLISGYRRFPCLLNHLFIILSLYSRLGGISGLFSFSAWILDLFRVREEFLVYLAVVPGLYLFNDLYEITLSFCSLWEFKCAGGTRFSAHFG